MTPPFWTQLSILRAGVEYHLAPTSFLEVTLFSPNRLSPKAHLPKAYPPCKIYSHCLVLRPRQSLDLFLAPSEWRLPFITHPHLIASVCALLIVHLTFVFPILNDLNCRTRSPLPTPSQSPPPPRFIGILSKKWGTFLSARPPHSNLFS